MSAHDPRPSNETLVPADFGEEPAAEVLADVGSGGRRRTRPAPSLPPDADRWISIPQFAQMLGVSTVTIWRLRRSGQLPEPTRVSPGCPRYPLDFAKRWATSRGAAAQ